MSASLDKFEIVEQFGPYRFIGASVYVAIESRESGIVINALWENSEWIFEALDQLEEYATDEKNHFAFITYEKYDEKTGLMGYTIGRFMKANTPVPKGMNYFDIEEMAVGKGWISVAKDCMGLSDKSHGPTMEAIKKACYIDTSYIWSADAYPPGYPQNPVPDKNGVFYFGTYTGCKKK